MIVALTGTPGTGKTTVAPLVTDQTRFTHVDLNAVASEYDLDTEIDPDRDAAVVDTDALNDALQDHLAAHGIDDALIDGHLSHHLAAADLVVVLRTHPDELETRLATKGWNDDKIRENVLAERIDTVLQEAVAQHPDAVYEVDTTDRSPDTVADDVIRIITAPDERAAYEPGTVAWDLP